MKSERELWLEKRVEEQRVLIETLEGRIKGLHVANDSFGDLARRVEELEQALANVDASDGVPEYVRRNVRAALAAAKGGGVMGRESDRAGMGMGHALPQEGCSAIEHKALREENARLRQIVKGVHGALTDSATVVVPGSLDADLYAPVMQIVKERDEARAEAKLQQQAGQVHMAEVARLSKMCCVCEGDCCRLAKDRQAEVSRLEGLILMLAEDERGLVTMDVHDEAERIRAQRKEGK